MRYPDKIVLAFSLVFLMLFSVLVIIGNYLLSKLETISVEDLNTGYFVDLDGLKIHYAAKGNGSKHVVLVHGFGDSLYSWRKNIDFLAQSFSVYALDLMGFGYSTRVKTSDYSTLKHAQIVKKFIDHFGLEKVSLVGNSLGAEVVLQFAAAYPDVVEKLVLIDGPPYHFGSFPFYFAARIPLLNKALLYIFMLNSYSAANIYRTAYFDRSLLTDEELQRSLGPLHVKGTADALIAMTRSELATLDFSKIPKVETLIIWGRKDAFINVQQTNRLESVLPHSKVVILENAGHVPHVEKPDDVNRLLSRFLFS